MKTVKNGLNPSKINKQKSNQKEILKMFSYLQFVKQLIQSKIRKKYMLKMTVHVDS